MCSCVRASATAGEFAESLRALTSLAGGGLHDGVQHALPLLIRLLLRLLLLLLLLLCHLRLPALQQPTDISIWGKYLLGTKANP